MLGAILLSLATVVLVSCAAPQLNTYVPTDKEVIYRDQVVEKLIYKEGGESSVQQARAEYQQRANPFQFRKSKKDNLNTFALIIGIDKYRFNSDVAYADNSALAFEELAQKTLGIPNENIITLINNDASSGQIKSQLEAIRALPEQGGTIYLFYAGHGVPGVDGNLYLLPADMSADAIHLEPRLQLSSIYRRLSTSMASTIYVFMDSCFSGQDDQGDLLYKGVAPVLRVRQAKVESPKLTIMTAGESTDFANDYPDKHHRLFSYYLIDSLAQGNTNLSEIYSSIRLNVKRTSLRKGIGYKQIPQLYGASSLSLQ